MFGKLIILELKVIFLADLSIVKIFLMKLSRHFDNYFMFGKYNGFVNKASVSACLYCIF
jgi:hypothetical protein